MIHRRKPLRRSTKPIRRSAIKRKAKTVRPSSWRDELTEEQAREERRKKREFEKKREIVRYKTFMRASGCCENCGRALVLKPSAARHEFEIANVHEEPPRSRGGDPLDVTITVCLCCHCHERVTRNRIGIKWKDPELKAVRPSGPVFFAREAA